MKEEISYRGYTIRKLSFHEGYYIMSPNAFEPACKYCSSVSEAKKAIDQHITYNRNGVGK